MKKAITLFEIYLMISIIFIFSISSGSVFAQDNSVSEKKSCCKEAKNGQFCVDGLTQGECAIGFVNNLECSNTAGCNTRGCCNVDGNCVSGAVQEACTGEFYNDAQCNVDQCKPKCCVVGNNCGLMSASSCEEINGVLHDDITDITSCNNFCEQKSEVCCKTSEGCSYTNSESCNGEPFPRQNCNFVQGCECEKTETTGCVGNDLYSYDSCGNPKLKEKCDYSKGFLCSDNGDGKFNCKNMNCLKTYDNPLVDENLDGNLNNDGGLRKNGESWCEYQSAVGPGLDLPGTAHYVHSCVNGKEEVVPCGSKRDKICAYFTVNDRNNYPFFEGQGTVARCMDNDYENCLKCNDDISLDPEERESDETRASCCKKAGMCNWVGQGATESLNVGKSIVEFYFVVPKDIRKNKLKDTAGTLNIVDSEIKNVKLSDVNLLFVNTANNNLELTENLGKAKLGDGEGGENAVAYLYSLELGFPENNIMTNYYNINISYNGKNEFLSNFEIPPKLDQQGYCVPFVSPANIPIKADGADYQRTLKKAEEECDKASNKGDDKEIKVQWAKNFWKLTDDDKGWNCKKNCDVYPERKINFTLSANYICNVFGDCGAKYDLLGRWSERGYYFDCGDLSKRGQKNECQKKYYYLTTAPYSFEKFKNAGKGFFSEETNVMFSTVEFSLSKINLIGANFESYGNKVAAGFAVTAAVPTGIIIAGALAACWSGPCVALSGLGPFGVLAAAIVTFIIAVFGAVANINVAKDTRESFTSCDPWEASKENECWRCHTLSNETKDNKLCDSENNDCGLVPVFGNGILDAYECNPHRCASLGKDCAWHNTAEGAKCVEEINNDASPPIIKIKKIDYECQSNDCRLKTTETNEGAGGNAEISGKLKPGYKIGIKFDTINPKDKGADLTKCKYSFDPRQAYEEMEYISEEFNFEHELNFNSLDPGEHNVYFACEDTSENNNEDRYLLRFNIAEYPDKFAPIILQIKTGTGEGNWNSKDGQKQTAYIPNKLNLTEVQVVVNEKVSTNGCKWTDKDGNLNYDQMTNYLTCEMPSDAREEYKCTTLINIKDETKLWFRCEDLEKNKAVQSVPNDGFKISKSDELKIDDIKCLGNHTAKCEGTVYDSVLNLEVYTSGGAYGGSDCTWNVGSNDIEFFEGQGTNVHKQPGYNLILGSNTLLFKCKDKAGNFAEKNTSFVFDKDITSPRITRVYKEEGELKVEVNEDSICKYSTDDNFDFSKGNNMNKQGFLHSTSIENNFYKIGCKDIFENFAGPFDVYINNVPSD